MDNENQTPFDDHITQRKVQELAQLLNQTTSRAVGESNENKNSICEADWAASHLLANFLMHAEILDTFPSRKNTELLLQSKGFEISQLQSLEQKFWVRFILGKLHIPRSIKSAIRAIESTIRNDSDKQAMEEYSKKLGKDKEILLTLTRFLEKRNHFWLSKKFLKKLRDAHRNAHSKTPTLKKLFNLGVIEAQTKDSQDGFILVFQNVKVDSTNNFWHVLRKRISALLWEWLCDEDGFVNDSQRLGNWLQLVSELDTVYAVEKLMSAEKQERFKFAMRSVLVSEPDIQGRETELQKLRWESDYGFGGIRAKTLTSKRQSLLDIWHWWQPLGETTWRPGFGRAKFDSFMQSALGNRDWYQDDDFLESLLVNSHDKPYLFHVAIRFYQHARRAGIARMLQKPQMASLGLKLLTCINLNENEFSYLEDRSLQAIKTKNQKIDFWQRGVDIVCRVAQSFQWRIEDNLQKDYFNNMVIALSEALLFIAREVYASEKRSNGEIDDVPLERLKVLTTTFSKADLFEKFSIPIYHFILKSIKDSISASSTSNEMPIAAMKVFFWLLENALDDSKEAIEIANGITALYSREIKRWRAGNKAVSWHDSLSELTEFDWSKIARILVSNGQLDLLLKPLDYIFELKSVKQNFQQLSDDNSYSEYGLTRTWLQKIRTHVFVLLRIHRALQEKETELKNKIETAIRELIAGTTQPISDIGQVSLFSHELDNQYSNRSIQNPFIDAVIKGINTFSAKGYKTTFDSWIEKEENPDVLLAIVDSAISEGMRNSALERLNQHDLQNFLETQLSITGFERLIDSAVLAGESNIVRRILSYLDTVNLNDTQRTNWQKLAFRVRLMLAYQEKDLETIINLESPRFERFMDSQLQRDFSNTRIFYRALLELETNPEEAYRGFNTLLEQDSLSSTYGVNRFAAAVHVAQAIVEPEFRKQKLLDALEEWQKASEKFSEIELKRVEPNACYSRLIVFDATGQDEKFEREWRKLTNDLKMSVPYVDIAVQHALRRNMLEAANAVYAAAKPYHTDFEGNVSNSFEEIKKRFNGDPKTLAILVETGSAESGRVEKLRAAWLEITQATLTDYVRIIGSVDLQPHQFLIKTLLSVLREFLLRINLIQKARLIEDELSDFVLSLLRMHFRFPWSLAPRFDIGDQSRGGSSETKKGAGERDGVIRFGTMDIAIFEALVLDSLDTSEIKKHVEKAVLNYNPTRVECIYILVYFRGIEWSDFWEKYKNFIFREIVFDEYVLDKDYFDETTKHDVEFNQGLAWKCFGYKPKNIGEQLRVYHIAVNLSQ